MLPISVSVRLDYCNSYLLYGTSQRNFGRLQRVQNSLLACVMVIQVPLCSSAACRLPARAIAFRAIHTAVHRLTGERIAPSPTTVEGVALCHWIKLSGELAFLPPTWCMVTSNMNMVENNTRKLVFTPYRCYFQPVRWYCTVMTPAVYHRTAPASCLFRLSRSFFCSLRTGSPKQYSCCCPRSCQLGHFHIYYKTHLCKRHITDIIRRRLQFILM